MLRLIWLGVAVACGVHVTHAAAPDLSSDEGRRWAVVVAARGGDAPHSEQCLRLAESTVQSLWRAGFDAERVAVFCESPESVGANAGPVTRAAVLDHLDQLRTQLSDDDELWVFLFGYANINSRGISYLTTGRRLRGSEVVDALNAIPGRQVVLALHRQSAPLAEQLADERRVVITATSDPQQLNWPKLTQRLIDVIGEDPSQSLLQILRTAAQRTEAYYRQQRFIYAERAQAHDGVAMHVAPFEQVDESTLDSIRLARLQPMTQPADGSDPTAGQTDRDVGFLKLFARAPDDVVSEALRSKRLVVLAHDARNARQWQACHALIEDPEVSRHVGVIYLTLSKFVRPLIDAFLASPDADPAPIIEALRNTHWTGTPDQSILEFIVAVWHVNQTLDEAHRITIVPVYPDQNWPELRTPDDRVEHGGSPYERDILMAESILADLKTRVGDPRAALFITDRRHAARELVDHAGQPIITTAWMTAQELGMDRVCTIRLLGPGQTQRAGSSPTEHDMQRIIAAFGQSNLGPVAVPLEDGPFAVYVHAYSAVIFVEPTGNDSRASIIDDFYTPAFLREIDRRAQIDYPKMFRTAGLGSSFDIAAFAEVMEHAFAGHIDVPDVGLIGAVGLSAPTTTQPATQPASPGAKASERNLNRTETNP